MCTAVFALVVIFIGMQCFAEKHGKRHLELSKLEQSNLHEIDTEELDCNDV